MFMIRIKMAVPQERTCYKGGKPGETTLQLETDFLDLYVSTVGLILDR